MKKLAVASIMAVLFSFPVQAQFLKKLQKKVEQRVEDMVANKVADKAAAETSKSMDNLLNFELKNSGFPTGIEPVDPAEVPEKYEFDYSYKIKMESRGEEMFFNYLLKKDAPYFGFTMPGSEEMYFVMDPSKNMSVIFMNSSENKFMTATKLPEVSPENMEATTTGEEFSYKKIGNKTILGYDCSGFQAENKEAVYTFYLTNEADITFENIYKNDKTNLPSNFDSAWLEEGKGLMMQMIMEDKTNAKNNMNMICTGIEKNSISLLKADYLAGN